MQSVQLFNTQILTKWLKPRVGEQKLGQHLRLPEGTNWVAWLANQRAKFVVIGVPEDIGVRANGGLGGANNSWDAFLHAFVNVQENSFLKGKDIILLGQLEVRDLMEKYTLDAPLAALKEGVTVIDERLTPVIEAIVSSRKIPIIIGGGHNNAYPNLKGLSLTKNQAVNCINLDAHADYRTKEGRHSGNGFRYAKDEGYLGKYAVLGLHEAYNNQDIIDQFSIDPTLKAIWYESIALRKQYSFSEAIVNSLEHVKDTYFGLELDLDVVEDTLSSAMSPLGFSRLEAYQFVYEVAQQPMVSYAHFTEGVALREDGLRSQTIGKYLSFLVQAFIKGNQRRG